MSKPSIFSHKNHSCKVCDAVFSLPRLLYKHIKECHSISTENYHNLYYKKTYCLSCGGDTKFISILLGYDKHCSRTCSTKTFRKNLKEDVHKFEKFRKETSKVVTKIWEQRSEEEKQSIHKKTSDSLKENNQSLTLEERKFKYGWLNKVAIEDREKQIEKITNSLKLWWKTASEQEKLDLYNRRADTLRKSFGPKSVLPEIVQQPRIKRKITSFMQHKMHKALCELFQLDQELMDKEFFEAYYL